MGAGAAHLLSLYAPRYPSRVVFVCNSVRNGSRHGAGTPHPGRDPTMPRSFHLGEFEQLVLLILLREGPWATAPALIEGLAEHAPRPPSRGAVYRTLDRLAEKEYVVTRTDSGSDRRGGLPRRSFRIAPEGVAALKESRATLLELWSAVEGALD